MLTLFIVILIACLAGTPFLPDVREIFKGRADFGQRVKASDYVLSMEEVRFWVSMTVRYNPCLPLILTSFWIGLGGLVVSAAARFNLKGKSKSWPQKVKTGKITASNRSI